MVHNAPHSTESGPAEQKAKVKFSTAPFWLYVFEQTLLIHK